MKFLLKGVVSFIVTAFLAGGINAHEIRPAYLKLVELKMSASQVGVDVADDSDSGNNKPATNYSVVWKQPIRSGEILHLEPVLPENCQEVGRSLGESTDVALIQRWKVSCSGLGIQGTTIAISGLDTTIVDAFVEIVFKNGSVQTHILRPGSSSFTVDEGSRSSGSASYLWLGIEHLLQGYDHILFIIGLVLLVRSPLNLLKVVTSFTVAHSLTLALATFGIVKLQQAPVEAVIALSIVFLAVELIPGVNAQNESIMQRYPWAITFVFGLLHGFGFAGALTEIGLPEQAATMALLLFNIGVEMGQLIIVAAMLLILGLMAKLKLTNVVSQWPLLLQRGPAYVIGTLAAFWFIERSLTVFALV